MAILFSAQCFVCAAAAAIATVWPTLWVSTTSSVTYQYAKSKLLPVSLLHTNHSVLHKISTMNAIISNISRMYENHLIPKEWSENHWFPGWTPQTYLSLQFCPTLLMDIPQFSAQTPSTSYHRFCLQNVWVIPYGAPTQYHTKINYIRIQTFCIQNLSMYIESDLLFKIQNCPNIWLTKNSNFHPLTPFLALHSQHIICAVSMLLHFHVSLYFDLSYLPHTPWR